MMEPIEPGGFELANPTRGDAAPSFQAMVEAVVEANVEAIDQLVEVEPNRRVVRRDDGASADPNDHVDGNVVMNELPQDADVSHAAQARSGSVHPVAPLRHLSERSP
jgi:hypothetical protein